MHQLPLNELEKTLKEHLSFQFIPLLNMRASQIYKWICRGVSDFDQMTDIPSTMRQELKEKFLIYSSTQENCYKDKSAAKIVIALSGGIKTEAVLLRDKKMRLTACLSTQAGCPARCVFCKTGHLGFLRNLTCQEIIEQFIFLQKLEEQTINNIVIMGMGEPLLNITELRGAVKILTDPNAFNYSKRKITVSTCGIYEGLFDIAQNGPYVRLALSLVTGDEHLRQRLMPITAANPLQKIKEALMLYQRNSGRRITLEAPLLGGINTSCKDALSIAKFAQDMETVVNIIPWNPVAGLSFEGAPLKEPEKTETLAFVKMLEGHGLKATMRHRRGRSIGGACGQLGSTN